MTDGRMVEEVEPAELDAALADTVMGWYGEYHVDDQGWWTDEEGNRLRKQVNWRPCSDLNGAWDVQDRLREEGWRLTLVSPGGVIGGTYLSTEDPWEAILFRPEGNREIKENGESAPHAIARAALRHGNDAQRFSVPKADLSSNSFNARIGTRVFDFISVKYVQMVQIGTI